LDVPAVSQDWVIASLYCKKLLPLKVRTNEYVIKNKPLFLLKSGFYLQQFYRILMLIRTNFKKF
jgi:hypothetical protein